MRFFAVVLSLLLASYLLLVTAVFAQTVPRLQITSPSNEEVVSGDKLTVKFQLEDFKFADFRKTDLPKQGEGHLLIWLDEQNPTPANAKKHISTEPYLIGNLGGGDHTLTLELVHSDGSSFVPKVAQTVSFKSIGPAKTPTTVATSESQQKISKPTQIAVGVAIATIAIVGLAYLTLRPKHNEKDQDLES